MTPIRTTEARLEAWEKASGRKIQFRNITIGQEYSELVNLLKAEQPQAIVHFAEQRAAPYSMKTPKEMRYTVNNNLTGTHDLLCGVVDAGLYDTHIVHMGTMGVYGYGAVAAKIPEGYLTVTVDTNGSPSELEFLYPPIPGRIYYMTKSQSALLFFSYNKNYGIRITDLHQGNRLGHTNQRDSARA